MWRKLPIVLFMIITKLIITTATYGQVTFIIESLPNTTPEEDTIFICGTFNNWNIHSLKYMLHPQINGTYSITLPADTGTIQYKFGRGTWMKIETNSRNEYHPNRKFTYGNGSIVRVKIQNWQDLGGMKHYNYLVLYLFAAAFYGLSLLFLVYRIQKPNRSKRKRFFLFNVILIITLLGGVAHNQMNLIWQSHIATLGYLVLYAWGPSLSSYLSSLDCQKYDSHSSMYYLPLLFISIVILLLFIDFKPLAFLSREIQPHLSIENAVLLWFGVGINTFHHFKLFRMIRYTNLNKELSQRESQLIQIIFYLSALAILVLCLNYFLLLAGMDWEIFLNYEWVLIVISFIVFTEIYYYWRFPEILRDKIIPPTIGNATDLIERLDALMKKDKPFKNPELNIAELADLLDTKSHILSRVINEHFNKNYRDFINEYRVREFITMSLSDEYKNYTFLALAHEVGFNSKSTFNLAFKKITGRSPREYLKVEHNILRN